MKEHTSEFILRTLLVVGVLVLVLLLWQIVTILLLIFGAVLTAIILRMLSQPLGQRLGVSTIRRWHAPLLDCCSWWA